MSHRVLIITYQFPPAGGVGAPRYIAYTRHLPAHGCEVSVIAPKNPHTPVKDPELLKKVPPETAVYRVFNPNVPYAFRDRLWSKVASNGGPSAPKSSGLAAAGKRIVKEAVQRFFTPDVQKFWVPFVLRKARAIIREKDIQTVIITTPPFSLHLLIPPLKREFPHLRWITEVRDDWVGYYLVNFDASGRYDYKRQVAVKLEGEGMRASDYVIAVTPAQRDSIRARYPDQPAGKFLCVPNGYDSTLYEDFRPSRQGRDHMVVTYFGSLYATAPYDITAYLEALDSLPDEIRSRIETRFIGRIAGDAEALLAGRKAKIVKLGFFPLQEGVRKWQETDYLLLAANDPTQHAAKLFDYLATGLPILALSPAEGEVARLLRETGGGVAVHSDDRAGVRQMLLDAFGRLQGAPNAFPIPNREAIAAYDRKNLTAQMVRLTGIRKE